LASYIARSALEHEALGGDQHGEVGRHVRGLVQRAVRQHGELVATEAGEHVVAAQAPGDRCREGAEQLVAGRVAADVVDVLEAVQVRQQQRSGPAARELGVERAPVERVRERVTRGEPPQLGDVLELARPAQVDGGRAGGQHEPARCQHDGGLRQQGRRRQRRLGRGQHRAYPVIDSVGAYLSWVASPRCSEPSADSRSSRSSRSSSSRCWRVATWAR
jgi:hypothetical protein